MVVVGGGIAGLATAWHLAQRGAPVTLLEAEPLFASHASGRNAAIFRQLEHDAAGTRLARRSAELLRALEGDGPPMLDRTGALYLGTRRELSPLGALAAREGVMVRSVARDQITRVAPALWGCDAESALFVPGDGVLDVHAIAQALVAGARARGATLRTGVRVERVESRAASVTGVRLSDETLLDADAVVFAVGAWSASLGAACGLPMPVQPRRRHLALLIPALGESELGPIVWRLDEEIYLRREAGGLLASPCDEQDWPPGVPTTDPEALAQLASRVERLAPELAAREVRAVWACLRSFAPDAGLVAGADPRLGGLTWVAGLGGRGMSVGLALGEVAAKAVLSEAHPLGAELAPDRLLRRKAG